MGRIQVLDDHLIDRIAAGEVVERPASVVKELVENSLDAGAGKVEILIRDGGKRKIRVMDDGEGMDRDDALLALQRHATSKLRDAGDLDDIRTLGFRGEALPSIAAVSQFTLATSREDGAGTVAEIRGGKILSVKEAGLPRGTSVEVDRLFFNVPARRKFLRAEATELSHIVRYVTRQSLVRPEVRFVLEHGDRTVLSAPRAGRIEDRIRQVLGSRTAESLLPFRLERGKVAVHGFAGRPVAALPRRDSQHLFVNGRSVQDRILAHAISQAYGNTVARGLHPAMVLFVEVDPALLDVNVHPQKTEVRFHRSGAIHDAVAEAVRSALSAEAAVPSLGDLRPRAFDGYVPNSESTTAGPLDLGEMRPVPSFPRQQETTDPPDSGESTGPVVLAQYRDAYIVAGDGEGLVIVDQHAAHERILFEQFLEAAERNEVDVQRLMFPVTLELSPDERVVFERESEEFRRLGFLVEPFGGNAVRLDGIPALAGDAEPEAMFHELLGEAGRKASASSAVEDLRYRLVTTAACKAAVKINHPLHPRGMQRLLDDLYATANPTTCPHGRPIVFRLTLDEIERAFRRR